MTFAISKTTLKLIALIVITSSLFIYQFMAAWTPPTAIAPQNNTSAPINISSEYQAKLGDLGAVRMRAGWYCDENGDDCVTSSGLGGQFGNWSAGAVSITTKAATSGFVLGMVNCNIQNGSAILVGYTDSSAVPVTVRGRASGSALAGVDEVRQNSFLMPVRAGDYWRVVRSQIHGPLSNCIVNIDWLPLRDL